MSLNINHCHLAGNLTRDPQIRFLANEQSVANFGLAINRKFKAAGGDLREEVVFLDIECWGKLANTVAQFLTKGSPAYIDGRLKQDTWQDKDGKKQSKIVVVAESVQFLGPKREQADGDAPTRTERPARPAAQPAQGDEAEPPF